MGSKLVTFELPLFSLFFFLILLGFSSADVEKDKAECATQLVGLATCLPYVGGDAKAPTPDCCTGLKEVLEKSKKCLCVLVKDRNDPSLNLKINATLALSLPTLCHAPATVANISECLQLLHLSPNSPDAKVFQDFAKSAPKGSISTPSASVSGNSTGKGTSTANEQSNGGDRRIWMGLEIKIIVGFLIIMLL